MALRYSTPKLRVLDVDVNRFDSLCRLLKVNTGLQGHLPTLIMFEDGKEVLRFPFAVDDKQAQEKTVNYKEKEIAQYFDLDKRHLATRETFGVEKKKAAT